MNKDVKFLIVKAIQIVGVLVAIGAFILLYASMIGVYREYVKSPPVGILKSDGSVGSSSDSK